MKKFNIDKVLGVAILVITFWLLIGFNHFNGENGNLSVDNEPIIDYDKIILKEYYINSMDNLYTELKKEDEKRRLEEYNKRMEIVKQEREEAERKRLAKIEAKKKRKAEQQRQQELANKRELNNKNKTDVNTSGWTTYHATYYTPYCTGCSGTTKAGVNVRSSIYYQGMRIVASDNSVLPLWSIIEVLTPHEHFKAIVLDSGSAIVSKKLDILVSTKEQAYSLGRHDVKVKVIRYGK